MTEIPTHPIAYVFQNCIFTPDTFQVVGVLLGGCVYGKNGQLKGKSINKVLYTKEGEMLAREVHPPAVKFQDRSGIMQQAWDIIRNIVNHDAPWISIKSRWSKTPLPEYLTR